MPRLMPDPKQQLPDADLNITDHAGLEKSFDEWIQSHPTEAKALEIPEEFLPLFIPDAVRAAADNSENLRTIMRTDDPKTLTFLAYEQNCKKVLTPPESWDAWQQACEEEREQAKGRITFTPDAPADINRLHEKYENLVKEKTIALTDRIMLICSLLRAEEGTPALYVGDYNGETGKGIGQDFYTNTLPTIARKLGFKFLTGLNDRKNISFFTDVLKRVTYDQLKPEYRPVLFPNANPDNPELNQFHTVQFLYPEDKKQFVIEEQDE